MSSQRSGLRWTQRSRLSWQLWRRTRRLRRLRRLRLRLEALESLRVQTLEQARQLERQVHPAMLVQLGPPPQLESQPPTPTTPPPPLEVPPPLTPEELASLPEMPDPVEELEHRLGLWTTPPSPPTSED